MPSKPNARKWNDIQTAIATAAIVTTIGLWNLVAAPSKAVKVGTQEPLIPPTETEPPVSAEPTQMPYVKVIFTPGAPQIVQQPINSFQSSPQQKPRKKSRNNNSGTSVMQTKSS